MAVVVVVSGTVVVVSGGWVVVVASELVVAAGRFVSEVTTPVASFTCLGGESLQPASAATATTGAAARSTARRGLLYLLAVAGVKDITS